MDTLLTKAIDEVFPNLDETTKREIHDKVSAHILEFLREAVYRDNPDEMEDLTKRLSKIENVEQRSKLYGTEISSKLQTLPQERQEEIMQSINEELTRVMHTVYKTVNSS